MMDSHIDIKYSKQSVIMAEQTRKIVLSNQPKFQKSWLHVSIIMQCDLFFGLFMGIVFPARSLSKMYGLLSFFYIIQLIVGKMASR